MTASGRTTYATPYTGEHLNKVAFPLGGMGAGMICLEGTGAFSHVSVRGHMDFYHAPEMYAALHIKGDASVSKVLEGPVPTWKYFGPAGT
ncbi:MAG: GH116 family glycosyl-hydrolase, partial [Candidatus Latescibacteria bacterium]|nr:GH116 family glycosyl-hydrolase [Candidatus Latescibacterota bacterium]